MLSQCLRPFSAGPTAWLPALLMSSIAASLALGTGCSNASDPVAAAGSSSVTAGGSNAGIGGGSAVGAAGGTATSAGGAASTEGSQVGGLPLAGASSPSGANSAAGATAEAAGGGSEGPDSSAAGGSSPEAGSPAPTLHIPWDWAGVVGTGQSLEVGDPGAASRTPSAEPRLTTQPFQNLQLSTANLNWPVDPNNAALSMVPLIEPIGRRAPTYPSSWPQNIHGETAHSAMANQITSLVKAAGGADYVNVHGEVGENGQCLSFLIKNAAPRGLNGRAYQATLIETRAITRLAQAAGKTYGVGAIIVTHGECDQGNPQYEEQLHQLWADYNTDLRAITGQTEPLLMIVSQQNSGGDRGQSAHAQWRIGVDFPNDVVCSGPKYQYPYSPDFIHMIVDGYEQLGEKYAQVYYERVVLGNDWQPLQPTSASRNGRVVTVNFHVPVPPLAWEDRFQAPHQNAGTEWRAGKGFELRAGNTNIAISAVEIAGDAVRITAAADLPANNLTVGYAVTGEPRPMAAPFAGTLRWGQLRDSDPFVGSSTGKAQPNFSVAFELTVP
jgi:hypothetical protein